MIFCCKKIYYIYQFIRPPAVIKLFKVVCLNFLLQIIKRSLIRKPFDAASKVAHSNTRDEKKNVQWKMFKVRKHTNYEHHQFTKTHLFAVSIIKGHCIYLLSTNCIFQYKFYFYCIKKTQLREFRKLMKLEERERDRFQSERNLLNFISSVSSFLFSFHITLNVHTK